MSFHTSGDIHCISPGFEDLVASRFYVDTSIFRGSSNILAKRRNGFKWGYLALMPTDPASCQLCCLLCCTGNRYLHARAQALVKSTPIHRWYSLSETMPYQVMCMGVEWFKQGVDCGRISSFMPWYLPHIKLYGFLLKVVVTRRPWGLFRML